MATMGQRLRATCEASALQNDLARNIAAVDEHWLEHAARESLVLAIREYREVARQIIDLQAVKA